jgi:hypothetical protein
MLIEADFTVQTALRSHFPFFDFIRSPGQAFPALPPTNKNAPLGAKMAP